MFNTAQMIIEEQKPNNSTETAILPMQCCAFVLFYYFSIKNLFNSRYLRCVGKQWSCPAYILPLFFETPDERVTPRNLLDSVECPMRGNNWTPARPDGVERHTFFTLNLPSIILCRFRMTHNVSGLCVVALSRNLKLTTTLDRAITQNHCYVPLNLELWNGFI